MININSKKLSFFISIFIGVIFIFSGISKLFPIHLTELNLVYHHISNWSLSPYIARILIITEVILGLALLFCFSYKNITVYVTLAFLGIFSIYLLLLLYNDGNAQNCGCFGSVLPMTPIQSLLKNIVLIVLLIKLLNLNENNNSKLSSYLFFFSSSISTGIIVISFPIYTWLNISPTSAKTIPFDFNSPIIFTQKGPVLLGEGKKLIAVFNMACNHCREVGFKLGILAKQYNFDNLFIFLVGENYEIDEFLKETHLNYPYKRYSFFEFIKLYPHSTWPWIISTENGIIKKQWIYETFDVKNFEK
jgi:hypothetical protein